MKKVMDIKVNLGPSCQKDFCYLKFMNLTF